MHVEELRRRIEIGLADPGRDPAEVRVTIEALWQGIESGGIRAAEPADGDWQVRPWVKQGILLAFRAGINRGSQVGAFHFVDRDTLPTLDVAALDRGVRVVPGGSTVRRGAFLGRDVVVMPPAYVNVGAYVGAGTMIDSHALVGSCAQVGARVHLSAAAQLGGVLEPIGARPVIVEDEVFVGGGCGIYEGTRVRSRAVLAPGVILTRAVPIYDLPGDRVWRATDDRPLEVPEGAVVVPGSRPAPGPLAARHGLALYSPVIIKYRDASTDAASALEDALR